MAQDAGALLQFLAGRPMNEDIPSPGSMSRPDRPPASLFLRLGNHVLGLDEVQREHVRRLLRFVALCAFCSLLLWIGTAAGLIPAWRSWVQVSYAMAGSLVLFVLIRGGFSRRFRDPSLAYGQLLFGISAVVLSYVLTATARGAALQLLCLLLAFGMDRLPPRRLLQASLIAVCLLALTSAGRLVFEAGAVTISDEIYNLLMAGVLLPVAIVVGAGVRRVHERQVQQREELARALTQLNELATLDALTGAINRRQMMTLLDQEQKRQRRGNQKFSVAVLDIDWFKRINDIHGHGVGDVVLRRFVKLVAGAIGGADTLARWGGEEFLLLMPACDQARAVQTVARIRQAVSRHDWASHGTGLSVTFSAGVAEHDSSAPFAETLEQADQVLYRAKHEGRDRTAVFGPGREPEVMSGQQRMPATLIDTVEAPPSDLPDLPPLAEEVLEAAPEASAKEPTKRAAAGAALLGRGPVHSLVDLVLTTDPAMRERLWLSSIAMALCAVWVVMFQWYAIPSGLMDPTIGRVLIIYDLIVMATFYPLIRSGLTARWQDPELSSAQMIAGSGACVVCYLAAPTLRPSLLHLLCVIQVFGMVKMSPRASRIAGVSAVLMLVAMLLFMVVIAPADFDPTLETLKIALACFILASLAMLSHRYGKVREKVTTQQQQLVNAVAQVQELVIRDALTGLFNRKHMQDLMAHERERCNRTGTLFSVALVDLDHFKRVNDTHGHPVGDRVLAGFANAALATLRTTDVICRWGGEEFLLLMPDTGLASQALEAVTRIRGTVMAVRPAAGLPDLAVTFSCGLTVARPGETLEAMIERADRALYAAKAGGRDRIEVAEDPDAGVRVDRRADTLADATS